MAEPATETMVLSNTYADIIVPVQTDTEDFLKTYQSYGAQLFGGRQGMIHVSRDTPGLDTRLSYSNIPKLYTVSDYESLTASGILRIQSQPSLGYKGKGILLGFIDTGIDFTSPAFLDSAGNSRILGIWDQTLPSDAPPYDLGYGSAFTQSQINQALQSAAPFSLVPSEDVHGHGTFLAGIAAGSAISSEQFLGAAPQADLAVVKLKEAKQYLKDFFLISSEEPVFQETDIMMGIRYLVILSILYEKPLIICLGLGTNQGDHAGSSALDRLLTYYVDYQNCFCTCAAGNETGLAHHFSSVPDSSGIIQTEFVSNENQPGFCMELWADSPALYTLSVTSPLGETLSNLTPKLGSHMSYSFLSERSILELRSETAEFQSGFQLFFLRFITPSSGVWRLHLQNQSQLISPIHIWLPAAHFLSSPVYFLTPDPDNTITNPGNTEALLTLGGYDAPSDAIFPPSGRGYSLSGLVKPDLTAPAVDVYGPASASTVSSNLPLLRPFLRQSGTSAASALAAGALALLINWSMDRPGSYLPPLNNRSAKNLLIRGAERSSSIAYPNREWGYGRLNLYGVLESLL